MEQKNILKLVNNLIHFSKMLPDYVDFDNLGHYEEKFKSLDYCDEFIKKYGQTDFEIISVVIDLHNKLKSIEDI